MAMDEPGEELKRPMAMSVAANAGQATAGSGHRVAKWIVVFVESRGPLALACHAVT